MEHICLSKSSNNNKNHYRNYKLLDINEKIQILHKINSNISHKYSFDGKINKNRNNNNINLLSSTLPSSNINKNINIYKKKLVKHNSTKNSPNILILKNFKNETKDYNSKERIINEIKGDKNLKQYIKNELKNEIIKEFLEDIANIDEQKVMNFLKIKNILMSSEKIKNEVIDKYNLKNKCNPDEITSNITASSNNSFNSEKKKEKHKLIFNFDEVEKKKDLFNKRSINEISPVKTIFNNLFINNNEKYIIKNPFHEHDKHLNNIKRRKLFIQSNGEIKLSNFNFQIINNPKNIKKNSSSFDCVYNNNNSSIYEYIIKKDKDKDNINKTPNPNQNIKPEIINNIKSEKENINPQKENSNNSNKSKNNINNININLKKHYFRPIINKEKIKNNKRYEHEHNLNSNSNSNLTKEININTKSNSNNDLKNGETGGKINIKESKKEKKDKKFEKKSKNIKKINLNNGDIKIEDEKRKKLIKKIIEDSKKIFQSKNILNDNKYLGNLFLLKRNNKGKFYSKIKGEILNKSFISRKNKNIKLNQINHHGFNTYSEHKDRNKTFSNFLNDKKSNVFRICHIKKYFQVLKKDNNKYLLNTKWLKNISKKNTPLLCFDKK